MPATYIFGNQTGPIPLSELDANFAAVTNAAALRAMNVKTLTGVATTTGYYAPGDGGGGSYWYNPADTTSADNGGSIIVGADGGRAYLIVTPGNQYAKQWGAHFDNATDDTPFINKAVAYLMANGGGTLWLPAGKSKWSSTGNGPVVMAYTAANITVNIRGAGKTATWISKFDASVSPVLAISQDPAIVVAYFELSDFTIYGIPTVDGIKITDTARFSLRNVAIVNCLKGLDNFGSLIFDMYGCNFLSCANGYYQRADVAHALYCNKINFYGCEFAFCSVAGANIDQGTHIFFNGCDVEANTGSGILIGPNMAAEAPFASIVSIVQTYFENNAAFGVSCPAGSGGMYLSIKDSRFDYNGGGVSINASVTSISFDNCASIDTIVTGAALSSVRNCSFPAFTDTASQMRSYDSSVLNSLNYPIYRWYLTNVLDIASVGGYFQMTGNVLQVPNGSITAGGDLYRGNASSNSYLLRSTGTLGNNAGGGAGTLTNAPSGGNPTKWLLIDDNGVPRSIPAW